jgi:hypothetical protein
MPLLTSSDDELDNHGLDLARQVLNLPPNSAQRDDSPITELTSIECTPAIEVQPSVEEKNDFGESAEEDEDTNAEFNNILKEAKKNFHGKKPEFITTGTRIGTSQIVDLGDDQTGDMTLEAWDNAKGHGYWVLEDNHSQKHIVKFCLKGKCYQEWLGIEEGFEEEPIAWPEKSQKSRRSSTVEDDDGDIEANQPSDDDVVIVRKDPDDSGHGLRKRTWSQKNPYKADKKIHAAAQKGKVKRISDIDAEEEEDEYTNKSRKRPRKSGSAPKATHKTKPRRSRSSTNASNNSALDLDPKAFKAHIMAKTTLKTVLQNDEPIPIFLSKCLNVTTLWDKVIDAWQPELEEMEGSVKSLSIRFPWLGPEYNIKLRAGLEGSYEKMLEEILQAPMWKDGMDRCTVDVVLVVM